MFKIKNAWQYNNDENSQAFEWLVEGLIPKNQKIIISGQPGTSKSSLAAYIGYCLTTNNDCLGFKSLFAKTLYVNLDNVKNSMGRLLTQMQLTVNKYDDNFYIDDETTLNKFEYISDIGDSIKKLNIDVLIIDTLQKFIERDLYNYKKITSVFSFTNSLIQNNCTPIMIHHDAKNSNNTIGSNGITGEVDVVLRIKKYKHMYNSKKTIRTLSMDRCRFIGDPFEETELIKSKENHHFVLGSKFNQDDFKDYEYYKQIKS